MNSAARSQTLDAIRALTTASVCNAIELTAVRLRNEGYMNQTIAARSLTDRAMLGHAITLQMRTDIPPVSGASYLDRSDWWEAFASAPFPKVVVIEDVSQAPVIGSVSGEIHAGIFKALGAEGLVTNGAVRDVSALEGLDFAVFSAGVIPSHGYAHIVGFGVPVTVGGIEVRPGDLLHGDRDGIVNIPEAVIEELPRLAAALLVEERNIRALCRSQGVSPDRLRAALTASATLQRRG